MRPCAWYALALVLFSGLAAAASWRWYPLFVDAYYHMAEVEGFRAAGGLVTQASWGDGSRRARPHPPPPALHVIGPLLGLAVVLPMGFGGRFSTFNVHGPLACFAGLGYDALLQWRESRPGRAARRGRAGPT